MQPIIFDQPYTFVPPRFNPLLHRVLRWILPRQLRKDYGIAAVECVGAEKLKASFDAGRGVMLVPNHCRPCDPLVLDYLSAAVARPFSVIASWHVFMASRFQRFIVPRLGGFSVYREGMDRESLKCSIKTVADGKFALIVFAEGIITRSNDRLVNFMEGPAFIARAAARKRADGMAVIHPVFIRYFFEGDLKETVRPVIEEIEKRLSWQPQIQLPLRERILKAGGALLALKEIEYIGAPQEGTFRERLLALENHLLTPLENQWCVGRHDGTTMARVKRLRSAILRGMIREEISEAEREARWRHLADLYLVQQLHCYPGDYTDDSAPERILETVERYEEDLTDVARPHYPMRVVITVGDAIEVKDSHKRAISPDPIMGELRDRLKILLEESKARRRNSPTSTEMS